jgi:hypothetical protein
MLRIRREQRLALDAAARREFEDRVIALLAARWTSKHAALGEQGARGLVQRASAKAEGFGFETEQQIVRFVNLTMLLGEGFDADPRHAWMLPLLRDRTAPADKRIAELCDGALARARGAR